MTPTHAPTLRCPNCKYDVSQTLRDAITTCPECGNEIAESKCIRVYPPDPLIAKAARAVAIIGASILTARAFDSAFQLESTSAPIYYSAAAIVLLCAGAFARRPRPLSDRFPSNRIEYFLHDAAIAVFLSMVIFVFTLAASS